MTATLTEQAPGGTGRKATPRRYLMCPPTHFDVTYVINPWMDPSRAVDRDLAVRQWEELRRTYERLGHRVELIDPLPGHPDMVFAANGALVAGGRVLGARFRNVERAQEAPAYAQWFRDAGMREVSEPRHVNEGEGDFLAVGERILAGTGFRTEPAAHREAQEYFGRPVSTLDLVDARYYHLDTALAVLDEHNVAYYPEAFSAGSRAVLETLFPDAVLASEADAEVFGLNAVSDGCHVVLPPQASGLAAQLRGRGYEPVPVDVSELGKAGGGVKCCTLEIRS